MVEKPMTIDIDDLLKRMPLEERLYRHRCVEAWSMAVPWTRLSDEDAGRARHSRSAARNIVRMETFLNPKVAPGQKQFWYPWPYIEGLTMVEATNELAFLVTGMYGQPVPRQDGAPLRLVTPWKYGFKSVKSIVKFTFTDKRPKTFWEALQAQRIRLLGQRQSRGAASALEPGDRARARHRRGPPADPDLERLWRVRRVTCMTA